MTITVQVSIDCSDPHGLAKWWAFTLGWTVEPQDADFIRQMIDGGFATEDEAIEYDGKLVWRTGAAIQPPSGVAAPRILFQFVPEQKTVKNRVHLDLRTGDADPEEVRRGLVERGATIIGGGRQGPHEWVTMTDPEGNEFCV